MGWGGVGCVNVRLHLRTKLMLPSWYYVGARGGVGCVNVRLHLRTKLMLPSWYYVGDGVGWGGTEGVARLKSSKSGSVLMWMKPQKSFFDFQVPERTVNSSWNYELRGWAKGRHRHKVPERLWKTTRSCMWKRANRAGPLQRVWPCFLVPELTTGVEGSLWRWQWGSFWRRFLDGSMSREIARERMDT